MQETELPDPRVWPDPDAATGNAARLHQAAMASIDADTGRTAARADADATTLIERMLAEGDAAALSAALDAAPSFAIARHLWRLVAAVERGDPEHAADVRTTLAAMPVVFVSALDARGGSATLPGVLSDAGSLEALLADARSFGGARTFSLSAALAAVDAIGIGSLPRHRSGAAALDQAAPAPPLDVAPAPMTVEGPGERVHLRFIVAAVLTAPHVDPLSGSTIAAWGIPMAQALARQLQAPGMSLLALPRPFQRFVPAQQAGRAVQREVSAQIFASNAIRKLRASVGEPTAIISAHWAADAPLGGELRLSLSSPFAPREAEGFRCPIYPYESLQDVVALLTGLLRDCRVHDVAVRAGVHADIDALTGGPLLFKEADATRSGRLQ